MNVSDVMTREVVTVTPEMRLRDFARTLSEHRISGAPVVDADDVVVGVISESDLVVKQLGRPIGRRMPLEWILGERHDPEELRRRAATTVGQAMSSPPVTIEAGRPIREAAVLMVDHSINRLPVTDAGRLVGILSRADLVDAYLRADEDILHTVRDRVLRRTMWLDPGAFDVEVREGVVRISGSVDRRTTAGIIERLIGITDGVIEVQSDIAWEWDDTHPEPPEAEREPGAASVTARERPVPMRR